MSVTQCHKEGDQMENLTWRLRDEVLLWSKGTVCRLRNFRESLQSRQMQLYRTSSSCLSSIAVPCSAACLWLWLCIWNVDLVVISLGYTWHLLWSPARIQTAGLWGHDTAVAVLSNRKCHRSHFNTRLFELQNWCRSHSTHFQLLLRFSSEVMLAMCMYKLSQA